MEKAMVTNPPRSAAQIRVAFKSLLAQKLPRQVTVGKVGRLLEEIRAAALSAGSQTVDDYLSLMNEIEQWCEIDGAARNEREL